MATITTRRRQRRADSLLPFPKKKKSFVCGRKAHACLFAQPRHHDLLVALIPLTLITVRGDATTLHHPFFFFVLN